MNDMGVLGLGSYLSIFKLERTIYRPDYETAAGERKEKGFEEERGEVSFFPSGGEGGRRNIYDRRK